MSGVDAATLADKAVRVGLITPTQVQDAWEEVGRNAEPAALLRCLERKGALTPFQSTKLLKGDTDGYLLGGYRLLYKIASGSFGRVYRAGDRSTGRVVALKVLRQKWTADKHKVEMFVREGKMGMTLHHPNIVETLAVNYDRPSNQHYIVMEFVEGGNLRDFLHIRKKLQAPEVLKILEETTSALAYAFSMGATHRDMKLTNVLLSSQGVAKLVDFGLAGGQLGFEEKDDANVDRTVDYAGLEKVTGVPVGDPRSDIFFLGCVVYELLTGRAPMDRKTRGNARMNPQRYLQIPPMQPAEVNAPPSVFHLVENMMTLNASERFQTPTQLVERIREVRAEISGTKTAAQSGKRGGQRTIFLAEREETLQDLLRTKLKELGYRVLIAGDPVRALDRFRQQPFDLLIVNAATTGENGYYVFQRIMEDARRQSIPCNGILMLGEEPAKWKERLDGQKGIAVLAPPVKYKQLVHAIKELI
jgi:eukaryotic-like serine/threonine-protein kinase